jgi:hypothetical protein
VPKNEGTVTWEKKKRLVRSEVLTVVAVQIPVFWDMIPCDWYISDIVEESEYLYSIISKYWKYPPLIFNLGIGMR